MTAAGAGRGGGEPLVVVRGFRTPFSRAFGPRGGVPAGDLARTVLVETLLRSGVDPGRLDEVILGCAGQPVDAMNLGRVVALRAGVPRHVPGMTVHRNCGSGLEVLAIAMQRLRAGAGRLFLVGGTEAMSEAPFQLPRSGVRKLVALGRARGALGKARAALALRPRDLVARQTLSVALTDPVSGLLMGETAEVLAREYAISRAEQDEYAAESQRRAAAARRDGVFAAEIVPSFVPPDFRRVVDDDDGIRDDATPERLARLRPVFDRRFGTVTVGNACQLTDGAAALLVGGAAALDGLPGERLGLLHDVVTVGCDPRRMGLGPAIAIPRLLQRNGLRPDEIDLYEINEAFAVQVLACLRELGDAAPPRERLNVHGGAIALGHPVGATGTRLVLTLLLEMRRRRARFGVAALCVGGGQGVAALLENPAAGAAEAGP